MPALPDIDLSAIPEDQRDAVAALLRENSDLKDETATLKEVTKRLEHLVAELNHVVHRKKSEKLSEDDRQLAFEGEPCRAVASGRSDRWRNHWQLRATLASETAVAEVEEHRDSRTSSEDAPNRNSTSTKRNRGNLPKDLPRIELVVEPGSLVRPCGCGQMHKIGEDR